MSLSTQIITGSISALNLIKNYSANPSIAPALGTYLQQDTVKGVVSLQCESYKEVMDADISTQLIVDVKKGRTWISDNIAPKPRVWELKGYIGAAPWEMIASPVLQTTQAQKLANLRAMYKSREMLVFRTKNGQELVYVGMRNLSIDSNPAVQNRIPFSMTVQEVPVLSYVDGQLGIPEGTSNISSNGLDLGSVLSIATFGLSAVNGIVTGVQSIDQAIKDAQLSADEAAKAKEKEAAAALAYQNYLTLTAATPKPPNKTIKEMYSIPLPQTEDGTYRFTFKASVKSVEYTFTFIYTGQWNVTVLFPYGKNRQAVLYPNVTNWSSYTDFGLVANTILDNIGQNDLSKITLYMVEWA
jgi:hypothetical protein